MKQQLKTWVAIIIFSLSIQAVQAQESKTTKPKWASAQGYWVIESNIHTPKDHIIWFYTNDNQLVYKEAVTGVKLNPENRKLRMKLKKVLESAIITWQQKKVTSENLNYVTAILR